MLLLLSPAKSLNYDTPADHAEHSEPLFGLQSAQLIKLLKTQSSAQISALMDLSEPLAALNVARYKAWRRNFAPEMAKQALLAFDGDVYDGLCANTLRPDSLAWAQDHLCILSGLYGVLRPLDLMQPYRLEMGTALANEHGRNLYAFWGTRIADYLNTRLKADASPVVINLASQEYFKAVDLKTLKARVIDCVFEERRAAGYKIISFSAKRARGMMARFVIDGQLQSPDSLQNFAQDGYAYAPEASTAHRLVFRREAPPKL